MGLRGFDNSRRSVARVALLAMTMFVSVALVGGTFPVAGRTAVAQETPTPDPTDTGPAGPTINFLNPAQGYDPETLKPPREPGDSDPPKVSDRNDGVDTAYHIVAWTSGATTDSVVEASILYSTGNEITIGTLEQVSGSPTTWELFWDVPESLPEGSARMFVRLYQQSATGLEQVAEDEQAVDMQHKGETPPAPPQGIQPADETVELTWPTQNGVLGFHKPQGPGTWKTVVDYSASSGTSELDVFYSVTEPGQEPVFKRCGHAFTFFDDNFLHDPITNRATCSLQAKDLPTSVTAIAAVTLEGDKPDRSDVFTSDELTQDSADVHVVRGYVQDPAKMKVDLVPRQYFSTSTSAPTGLRRTAASDCLEIDAIVTDDLDRPVQGANLDVHLAGPDDQVTFAFEGNGTHGSSGRTVPSQGPHSEERGRTCDDADETVHTNETGNPSGAEAETNVPGGADVKHLESSFGTGTSGPCSGGGGSSRCMNPVMGSANAGTWRFHLYSPSPGFTDVTAWVDDEPLADPAENREENDDVHEPGEPSATTRAQWLPKALTVSFAPTGKTASPGSCTAMTVRVRSGSRALPGINVDVHATGPDNELDFCDPGGSSPRRAPDDPDSNHTPEDPGEASHGGAPPQPQHTEGETDDSGNFVIGLASPVTGDTTIEAWVDGEAGQDNDVLGSGEGRSVATINWLASLADAELSFINPSAYGTQTSGAGNGTRVANTRDADTQYHVVVRVDAVGVPGVELLVSQDGSTYRKIGDMTQIANSDLWELYWNVDATEDTSPTLRAQIPGTDRREDIVIRVENQGGTGPPPTRAFETAEIEFPLNGVPVAFSNSQTEIRGTASAGAEGIELYYTKAPAKDTPQGADWIFCGYVDLSGTGSSPQTFKGNCKLQEADQAALVTGVAAITFDCSPIAVNDGCDGNPTPSTGPRQPGEKDSGDAHRIYGFEGSPLLQLEPAESAAAPRVCHEMTLRLTDQTGQALADENVDVHVRGPANDVVFCDVENGSTRNAPDQGGHSGSEPDEGTHTDSSAATHHTEGTTNSNGRFIFGIRSERAGDSNLTAWLDFDNDDVQDTDERSDVAIVHWGSSKAAGKGCTVEGTRGKDRLRGTSGNDVICGKGGNDILIGARGKDQLKGGSGNDTLRGGRNADSLRGGRGRDVLVGGQNRDTCHGGGGRDRVRNCERGNA